MFILHSNARKNNRKLAGILDAPHQSALIEIIKCQQNSAQEKKTLHQIFMRVYVYVSPISFSRLQKIYES